MTVLVSVITFEMIFLGKASGGLTGVLLVLPLASESSEPYWYPSVVSCTPLGTADSIGSTVL